MSLRDDLATPPATPKSGFRLWFDGLDNEDQTALETAGRNPDYSTAHLIRVIKANGGHVTKDTLSAWRRDLAS